MSFSFRSESMSKNDIPTIVVPEQKEPKDNSSLEMIIAAKKAVAILAGAVGTVNDQVYISISGHANPFHEPCEGWANEHINISIAVVK